MTFTNLITLTKCFLYFSLFYSVHFFLEGFTDFYSLLSSDVVDALAIVAYASYLSGIPMLIWMYTVSQNAHNSKDSEMKYSPFSNIGWWFVPVVNLFKPITVMTEVWEVSFDSKATKKKMMDWWTYYVLYSVIIFVAVLLNMYGNLPYEGMMGVYGLVEFIRLVWVIVTLRFVQELSQQQISKWKIDEAEV